MTRHLSSNSSLMKFLKLCALLSVVHADFYKLLGVSRSASKKEIKSAYRKKSLEFHPDKNKAEGAAEKFAEINRAYEALSDEETRKIYDKHGEEGLKQHEQQKGGGGGWGGGSPFDDFFGFGQRQRRNQEQTTPSVTIPLELTLEQLFKGETFEVTYVRQVLCLRWEMCMKPNQECQGPGVRAVRQQIAPGFVQSFQQRDDRCVAPGKMWLNNCSECPKKTQTEKIDLTIDVNKGMRPNEVITFEGVTDEKPGYKPGDLIFVIQEKEHPQYRRDGDNLYTTTQVPLVKALTGFKMSMKRLDGTEFTVDVDDIIECDEVLRVPGKGMPRRNGRGYGDLFITFEVDFPSSLSSDQKAKLRQILQDTSDSDSEAEL